MKTLEACFWISFIISKAVFKHSLPTSLYVYFEDGLHFNILEEQSLGTYNHKAQAMRILGYIF